MIIAVGTTNPAKLAAVREVQEAQFGGPLRGQVIGIAVKSAVRAQPLTLDETIEGAEHRAREAWTRAIYGEESGVTLAIGLESGLMVAKFRTLDVCACVLFDGKRTALGLSGAWELPVEAVDLTVRRGFDLTQAFLKLGLTDDPKINEHGGAIACVTDGRITRTEYTKQAIEMALAGWGK